MESAIQLPYYNSFESIWEYSRAFDEGLIDWQAALLKGCPLCGCFDCWRALRPYSRLVTDLLEDREERIQVARFFCRTAKATFSLLPVQLVPYRRYTATSVVWALLLAGVGVEQGLGLFGVAEKELPPDSRANGHLLACWLAFVVAGLRRAHPELTRWAALGGVRAGMSVTELLAEVSTYCKALGIRGPPRIDGICGLDAVLQRHARTTGRFLFGTPSQERGGRAAP